MTSGPTGDDLVHGVPDAPGDPAAAAPSWAPSTVDVLFAMVLLVRGLTYWGPLLHTDGDAPAHIALGERILRAGYIPATDPFSWTMAGQPLFAHSWLGSVVFALVHRVAGLPGLVVLVTAVLALAYALTALFLRRRGVDPRIVLLVAVSATMLGTLHWLARPHVFSSLGAVLLLFLLESDPARSSRRRRGRLGCYAVLFAAWANLHGGFLFGLLMLVAYFAGACAELAWGADHARWRARAGEYGAALLVSVAACCLTPYGITIFSRLTGALGDGSTAALTVEYASPDFHDPTQQLLLAAVLATVALLAVSRRRMALPRLALLMVSLGFALYAVRNVDLFAVTGWPLVWLHAAGALRRRRAGYVFGDDFARVERTARLGPYAAGAFVAMAALAANGGRIGHLHFLPERFDAGQFPAGAVAYAHREGVQGRLFNDFRWGGYLIYAWPEEKVFIETLKYTGPVADSYRRIEGLAPGWEHELDHGRVDVVLVPARSSLASALGARSGWRLAYSDHTAALLRRVAGVSQ